MPVVEQVRFEVGEVGGALPDEVLAADVCGDFWRSGIEVFGLGVVLWIVLGRRLAR